MCRPCSSIRPCSPRLEAPLPPSRQPRWYTVIDPSRSCQPGSLRRRRRPGRPSRRRGWRPACGPPSPQQGPGPARARANRCSPGSVRRRPPRVHGQPEIHLQKLYSATQFIDRCGLGAGQCVRAAQVVGAPFGAGRCATGSAAARRRGSASRWRRPVRAPRRCAPAPARARPRRSATGPGSRRNDVIREMTPGLATSRHTRSALRSGPPGRSAMP